MSKSPNYGWFALLSGFRKDGSGFPWLLVLACAAGSALLMPRTIPFPYHVEKDQPWNYRTLKAPFDFEVLRPEAEVKDQVDHLKTGMGPYFKLNQEIGRQQKKKFADLVAEQVKVGEHDTQYAELVSHTSICLSVGQHILEYLYNRGILDPADPAVREGPGMIFVVSGANERKMPIREVLTVKKALEHLSDTLSASRLRQPESVLPLLEKVIVPNLQYSDSLTDAAKRRKMAEILSTGITVRKGDVIVRESELVSGEIYPKLVSLQGHYDTPNGWAIYAGYLLLALFGCTAYFLKLPAKRKRKKPATGPLFVLPLSILAVLALVSFSNRIGPAVPLLLPLSAIPMLLRRNYGLRIGLNTWALIVFLTTISLDWGAGWLAVQLTGLLGALWFQAFGNTWKPRLAAAGLTLALQIVVLVAYDVSVGVTQSHADTIAHLQITDAAAFLFASALLYLAAYPFRKWDG